MIQTFSMLVFYAVLFFFTTACDKETVKGQRSESVQAPQPIKAEKPQPAIPKMPIMNEDSRFKELIDDNHLRSNETDEFMSKYSPSFANELNNYAQRISDRKKRLDLEVAKYSDNSLREVAKAKFERNEKLPKEPEPTRQQVQEALNNFNLVKDQFIKEHADDYFVFGSYDCYYIKTGYALINLEKFNVVLNGYEPRSTEYLNRLAKIGKPLSLRICDGEVVREYAKMGPDSPEDKLDVSAGLQTLNNTAAYGQSGVCEEDISNLKHDIAKCIFVSLTMDEINQAYDLVNTVWNPLMDKLYNDEIQKGGFWLNIYGNKSYHSYSEPDFQKMRRESAKSIVRKQTIFLVGKGDPFDMKLKECGLMVSGTDHYVKKIF